jgi:sugar phosphate isomerase/epimerase
MNRRQALLRFSAAAAAITANAAAPPSQRKMTIQLSPGAIGVQATQEETIALAKQYGFESVEANGGYLATLKPEEIDRLTESIKTAGLAWGCAYLSVDFRKDTAAFESGMAKLPATAKALQRAGVNRIGTYVMPVSAKLTYMQNLTVHVERLRKVASVLGDSGLRLGLEYVAPKTIWASGRYPFVHTMAEMIDLIQAIGTPNLGLVMDSWHWYTAGDSAADLEALRGRDVICVDLNDAPSGVPIDQQIDSKRELPLATGVLPVADFLNALQKIGFDGPVRCEPFNAALRAMPKDQALTAVAGSMKKAFALIRE